MTSPTANDEMGVWQLPLQLLGRRQGRCHVVITPHEFDRAPHLSDRRTVILGKRTHENVPHDTGGRTVVIGPVALSQRLDPVLTDQSAGRQPTSHPEPQQRLRTAARGSV